MSRIKLTSTGFPSNSQLDYCIPLMKKKLLELDMKFEHKLYTFQYIHDSIHIQEGRNYSNERIKDIIYGFTIFRFPHTFIQTDIMVRDQIQLILQNHFVNHFQNILLIGGECYVFPFFFKDCDCFVYTDFESIYQDIIYNSENSGAKVKAHLVSYSNFRLEQSFDIGIINLSRDLSDSTWETIIVNDLIIIRCHDINPRKNYNLFTSWICKHVTIDWYKINL